MLRHQELQVRLQVGLARERQILRDIAEGLSRTAPKEQAHFLDIAYGSLMETDCQLDISLDLGYISREMREMLDVEINSIGKMIRSLKSHRQ